jgi:hypothetical protein
LPAPVEADAQLAHTLLSAFSAPNRYHPERACSIYRRELPGEDDNPGELDLTSLLQRAVSLDERLPGYAAAMRYLQARNARPGRTVKDDPAYRKELAAKAESVIAARDNWTFERQHVAPPAAVKVDKRKARALDSGSSKSGSSRKA